MADKAVNVKRFNTSIGELTEWVTWAHDSAGKFKEELYKIVGALKGAPHRPTFEAALRICAALDEINTQFNRIRKDLQRIQGHGVKE